MQPNKKEVKRQQIILAGFGVLVLFGLFFLGVTVPPKAKTTPGKSSENNSSGKKVIDIQDILRVSKEGLNPKQLEFVNRLENSVGRGDVKNQQLLAYHQLAIFWKDSVNEFLPAAYYTGEAAKLENSEKNLTFAARLFLNNLQNQDKQVIKTWMADRSRDLFEEALKINPNNDSSRIGLGATYIFGSSVSDPSEIMQGIQQILAVTKKDPGNMYAQYMLGVGGVISGQLDKAIERFKTVIAHQPENADVALRLADAYDVKGDKENAVSWYTTAKKLITDPEIQKEIDKRIKSLQ